VTSEDSRDVPMVQLLTPDGEYGVAKQWGDYAKYIDKLT
jgi:hypothetical protein